MATPDLIEADWSGTATLMAKGAPRKKLPTGMSAPVHVIEAVEKIVALETEANARIGSATKVSMSDLVSEAMENWVKHWVGKHGALPYEPEQRAEYVDRLAKSLLAEHRATLSQPPVDS